MSPTNARTSLAPLKSEFRDGMQIDWDVPIPMDDGVVLRANVFRPSAEGAYPVILSMGPYGKDLPMPVGYAPMFETMVEKYPDAVSGTTNQYAVWELVDPEKWTRDGYAVVRIDSRGAGRSPGVINCFSDRETRDLHDSIEWAAEQPWSTGKIGLNGTSYHGVNAWQVASMDDPPPHLAAFCAWEGTNDWYRECAYHGGIPSSFLGLWFPTQVEQIQHGNGANTFANPVSGLRITGDEPLPQEQLDANRHDIAQELLEHPFDDAYWRERSSRLEKIEIPFLSAGNWGGQGLHLRGNVRAFAEAPSPDRYLEVHGLEHYSLFFTDYGRILQRRFFDHYLKGEGDWAESQARLQLQIRSHDGTFTERHEDEWPIGRTDWTRLHLDTKTLGLSSDSCAAPGSETYRPFGEGLTFRAEAFTQDVEITGPLACRLWVSSASTDADIFLVLRAFDPEGKEVLFDAMSDPAAPLALGWLRASHRAIDDERSRPWQPYHPHDEAVPLVPGEIYPLDVEIWPTSVTLPAGFRLALSVLGRDFDHGLEAPAGFHGSEQRGAGIFLHPDRDPNVYDAPVTVHSGPDHESFLLVPFVPARASD